MSAAEAANGCGRTFAREAPGVGSAESSAQSASLSPTQAPWINSTVAPLLTSAKTVTAAKRQVQPS